MAQEQVIIFDTTLRDGEQAAGAGMTTPEKLEIARQLDRLGVDIIEAGFAASSPGDFEAVATIAREVRRPIIASLARAHPNDVDRAWGALQGAAYPRIHVFLSSSDIHLMHQLRKNREEVMDMAVTMVSRAKGYCEDVEFSAMDASRTEPEYLYTMLRAVIDAGATTINIPDTVGYSIPEEFAQLLKDIQENVPNIHKAVLSVHCHNDLGLGVANSMAAIQVGARQVEGCINGLGERAGNAALEEIIMSIETRKDFLGVWTNVDTTQIYRTSRLVSDVTGFPHSAQQGSGGPQRLPPRLRHPPGRHPEGTFHLRGYGPRVHRMARQLPGAGKAQRPRRPPLSVGRTGIPTSPPTNWPKLSKASSFWRTRSGRSPTRTWRPLMSDQRRTVNENVSFTMEHIQVSCGDHEIPTATVKLTGPDGFTATDAATGTGPVDAIYKAINRIVQVPNTLAEFTVNSVTGGIDAIGEVTIRIQKDEGVYVGRGSDTDILVASAKAYLNALNRLLAMEEAKKESAAGAPNP